MDVLEHDHRATPAHDAKEWIVSAAAALSFYRDRLGFEITFQEPTMKKGVTWIPFGHLPPTYRILSEVSPGVKVDNGRVVEGVW